MRTRAATATAPALLAALIAGTGLAACGGDDGPGSGYTYEPFNVTLAGLPSAARMWDLTTDARSVPVAVFDIGTYSYDWGTDRWTLLDATLTCCEITRLPSGDLLAWEVGTDGSLALWRRAPGADAFTTLPALPIPPGGSATVRSALVDDSGALYLAAVRSSQDPPLSIAVLPAGAPAWALLPLPLTVAEDTGEGTLATDAAGTTVLYHSYYASSLYLFARAPGAPAFTTVLSPATAEVGAAAMVPRPGADPLLYDGARFFRVRADGEITPEPGELAPIYNASGRPQIDATGRAYVMGAQQAYAADWDILSWDRGWTVEDTIGSDAKLTVAPNGDLYVAYGLGTPAGRLRR